jgi:hypothetical protein
LIPPEPWRRNRFSTHAHIFFPLNSSENQTVRIIRSVRYSARAPGESARKHRRYGRIANRPGPPPDGAKAAPPPPRPAAAQAKVAPEPAPKEAPRTSPPPAPAKALFTPTPEAEGLFKVVFLKKGYQLEDGRKPKVGDVLALEKEQAYKVVTATVAEFEGAA